MAIRIKKRSSTTFTITFNITISLSSRRVLLSFFFLCLVGLILIGVYQARESLVSQIPPLSLDTKVTIDNAPFPFAYHALSLKKEQNTSLIHKKEHPVLVMHGSREKKEIALTFDADMTYGMQRMLSNGEVPTLYDDRLIQILTNTQTEATVFLTGLWIETYPEESKGLAANSLFELASHSYSHQSFAGDCYGLGEIPDEQNDEELGKTQQLLKNLTGKENVLFRFPGGCYSESDLESLKKFGLTAIQWDASGDDGFSEDAEGIKQRILDRVQPGSIIVLHMNGGINEPETANVVEQIIPLLREQGYEFVTVSALLDKKSEQKFSKHCLSYEFFLPCIKE